MPVSTKTEKDDISMDLKYQNYIPQRDILNFNSGTLQDAWKCFGCCYVEELKAHRFLVWAPNARAVSIAGNFNGWDMYSMPMERVNGGVWIIFVEGLKNGDLYKYCVTQADGKMIMKADPFASFGQHGMDTASIVHDNIHYEWHDEGFLQKRAGRNFMSEPTSIYEVHAGSWKFLDPNRAGYCSLAEDLSEYCKNMGYTHVELMPLTEFPYDGSWGYQVTGYFSPTSRYGTPEDFKYFVDKMHEAGIGVILDWVPAHFPKDEHGLELFDGTPLFERKERRMAEHPEWGTLIFDYGSPQVQSFLTSSACLFFEEYHIDGIRVDAVTSMLYLNYGRNDGDYTPNEDGSNINYQAVNFLRRLNHAILTKYPGTVTIAEESSAYPLVTAPPGYGGLGFCMKWDMGYMHDTLDYMSLDPYFRSKNHNKLTFSMMYAFSENYVLAYSHDEVVHGKKSMIDKMYGDYEQKFNSVRALYGMQYAHPGKKLNFMGSEFGQFIEWNWQQDLDWLLLQYEKHAQLQHYCAELNRIYKQYPAFYRVDRSWDGYRWLNVDDNERSAIAFLRSSAQDNSYIACVCNFTPVDCEDFQIALPCRGTLKQIFSSNETRFGGTGSGNAKAIWTRKEAFLDMEHSAKVFAPGMSCTYFEFKPIKQNKRKK